MKPSTFSFGATLLAMAPFCQAYQKFYNSGTRDGWDAIYIEHDGTVEERTNVFYEGDSSLKMTQRYDPSYNGRYHSEVHHFDGYQRGEQLFYGFTFRLSESWQFDGGQWYNLAQFIAERVGAGCGGDDWMPSSMLWIEGDRLASRVVSGEYRQPDCSRDIKSYKDLATVQAGVWHKVVIQAQWESNDSGFYKIWFDGDKVLEVYNKGTTVNDDEVFQFRVGLYANGWHDDHHMAGDQAFRQVWYDEIAIGTEFKDVDPDQS